MKKNVLGIKIDDVNIAEIAEIVQDWLKKPSKYYIVTPNPEIIMMAQKDQELKNILNNADLSIPDGKGLRLGTDIESNSPGIDVLEDLVKLGGDLGFTIAFLGGDKGVAEKAASCLRKKYKNSKIVFAESGGEVDKDGKLLKPVKLPESDLLFVGFGPPKQEKWIAKNLKNIPVKIAMGVGGSFDYLSGQVPRAPGWVRSLGFEWLFRLIIQPWRIKRQLALIQYVLLLIMK